MFLYILILYLYQSRTFHFALKFASCILKPVLTISHTIINSNLACGGSRYLQFETHCMYSQDEATP